MNHIESIGKKFFITTMCSIGLGLIETGGQSAKDIRVAYTLESAKLTVHEPIILIFTVQNDSAESAVVDLGQDRKENFIFTVTRPDKTIVRLPQWSRNGISQLGTVSVEPGKRYAQEILLNEWAQFEEPGQYEIGARLAKPIQVAGRAADAEVVIETQFEILPRKPERLQAVCAVLLRRVYAAPSYEAAAEAALILSHVRDRVAVPYLQKMLFSRRMVEGFAVDGLQRIANREAINILIAAYGEGPQQTKSELQQRAGGALGMIAAETQDPELKEKILQALDRAGRKWQR